MIFEYILTVFTLIDGTETAHLQITGEFLSSEVQKVALTTCNDIGVSIMRGETPWLNPADISEGGQFGYRCTPVE